MKSKLNDIAHNIPGADGKPAPQAATIHAKKKAANAGLQCPHCGGHVPLDPDGDSAPASTPVAPAHQG